MSILRRKIPTSSEAINLYSDASLKGFGATYGSQFITGSFPQEWNRFSITVLETYPVLAVIGTFAAKLRNSKIIFH